MFRFFLINISEMEALKKNWNLAFVVKIIISQRYLLPDVWDVNTFTDCDSCHRGDYYMSVFVQQSLKQEKQSCSDKQCHKA